MQERAVEHAVGERLRPPAEQDLPRPILHAARGLVPAIQLLRDDVPPPVRLGRHQRRVRQQDDPGTVGPAEPRRRDRHRDADEHR